LAQPTLTGLDETGKPHKVSLSDSALSKLLKKLKPYQPRVIGLDVLRPDPATAPYLKNELETNQNLFVACFGKAYENELGVASPPELKNARERIGFSDVAVDDDDRVRRYLWYARFLEDSPCLPHQPESNDLYDAPAFSFLIAKHYLAQPQINIRLEFNEEQRKTGKLSFTQGKANLKQWQSYDSSPYKIGTGTLEQGFQVLLNYRNTEKDNLGNDTIASSHPLREVLENNFQPKSDWLHLFQNKIVLIGVTAESKKNELFLTPFSRNDSDEEKTWGIYLHAHMISQIISAVEDSRPFLSTLNKWQESIWIVFCAGMGIVLIYYCRSTKGLIISTISTMVAVPIIHIILFINGLWIPVVPALVVVVPSIIVLLSQGKRVFQDGTIIKLNNVS
jgi:CHASE2 domain-containing sensor protein